MDNGGAVGEQPSTNARQRTLPAYSRPPVFLERVGGEASTWNRERYGSGWDILVEKSLVSRTASSNFLVTTVEKSGGAGIWLP